MINLQEKLRSKNKIFIIFIVLFVLVVAWYLNQGPRPLSLERSYVGLDNSVGAPAGNFEGMMGAPVSPSEQGRFSLGETKEAQDISTTTDTDRKVVKFGTLNIIVSQTEAAAQEVQKIADRLGGLTQNVQIYGTGRDKKMGTVTVKVPVTRFDEAISAIRDLADEVSNLTVNTNDVTEQYIDLEARLKNMRAEEAQYQSILSRAQKIEEILQVTERLSDVRGRIEQAEARLKYLSEQVAMSTITVNLSAEGDVEVLGIHWRPSVVVRQSVRNMLVSLTEYVDNMIRLLFRLPILILWVITIGIGLLIIWQIVKFARRRLAK